MKTTPLARLSSRGVLLSMLCLAAEGEDGSEDTDDGGEGGSSEDGVLCRNSDSRGHKIPQNSADDHGHCQSENLFHDTLPFSLFVRKIMF